ncbi:hypothetical protein, partial [Thiocapsa sp. N5-Cardenillas]|uniref:hypothetical protein n=1 Tax=Thiocapsa sp. N5-Cardenillas TaxID=3137397 RepID=UPI0035B23576
PGGDRAVDGGRREDSRRITTRTPRHETGMSYFVPYRVRLNSLVGGCAPARRRLRKCPDST